jgi:tetratricopeptide (TPR) repeat protein
MPGTGRRWWLIVIVALSLWRTEVDFSASSHLQVAAALELYERGEYAAFFDAVDRPGSLEGLFPAFEKEANGWLREGDQVSSARRRIVAATVALEIAHRLRDKPSHYPGQYLVWASLVVRQDPGLNVPSVERLWYLACLSGMTELDQPWVFVTGRENRGSPVDRLASALGQGGQLAEALRRFPEEPRFQLARVASSAWFVEGSQIPPSFSELARRRAEGGTPERRRGDDWVAAVAWSQANRVRIEMARVPELKQAYEALGVHESLRAEIALHVGYLESVAMNHGAALDRLRRVSELTSDTYVRFLADYFIGRTYQNMGDRNGAREAFDRAASIVPNARSAATHLAAELLLTDRLADRERAYTLLQGTYSDRSPQDPLQFFGRGDARLWPVYMAHLRRALR